MSLPVRCHLFPELLYVQFMFLLHGSLASLPLFLLNACPSISATFGSCILYLKLEFFLLATGFNEKEFLVFFPFDPPLIVDNSKKSKAKRNDVFCPPSLNQWAILESRVSFTSQLNGSFSAAIKLHHVTEHLMEEVI